MTESTRNRMLSRHPDDARGAQGPRPDASVLRRAYVLARAHYGHLGWWPGDSPFEVCIGAILTQNTQWRNVEQALARLKAAGLMEPRAMFALPEAELAACIRPAGVFNVKARRLRAFLRVVVDECGADLTRLFHGTTDRVRARLLSIPGIGPETADCMLLYAGGHLSFVVDAYTRRIFARHGWAPADAAYEDVQRACAGGLDRLPARESLDYWQDYHAQLVMVGKDFCRPRAPKCAACPLRPLLPGSGPTGLA